MTVLPQLVVKWMTDAEIESQMSIVNAHVLWEQGRTNYSCDLFKMTQHQRMIVRQTVLTHCQQDV